MGLPLTVSLAAALVALAVFSGWRGARAPDPLKGPRLVPWRALMVLSAGAATPFLAHLLNLLGLQTGG